MVANILYLLAAAPALHWSTDLDAALRAARTKDKLVLVYVLDSV